MGIVAAYCRVSSKAQSLAMQRHAIAECARQRDEKIDLWLDEKESGKTLKRPVLDDLRGRIRLGTVSRVYTFKLDRITRSGVADTFAVVKELRDNKCELICVKDGHRFDDSDAADTLIFALSLGAKLERSAINDRISSARLRMEKEGRAWGRPKRGLGKKDLALGKKPIDVDRARRMKAEGKSSREISAALKVPRTTIRRALVAE